MHRKWVPHSGERFSSPPLFLQHLSLQQSPPFSVAGCPAPIPSPQALPPSAAAGCSALAARRGALRQPGWWPPEPARHWYAGRLGGARCGETLALGSREKWLSFSYPRMARCFRLCGIRQGLRWWRQRDDQAGAGASLGRESWHALQKPCAKASTTWRSQRSYTQYHSPSRCHM